MKKYSCEKCDKIKEELANNPIGGCVYCEHHLKSDHEEPCKTCFETYTMSNHYPEFKER